MQGKPQPHGDSLGLHSRPRQGHEQDIKPGKQRFPAIAPQHQGQQGEERDEPRCLLSPRLPSRRFAFGCKQSVSEQERKQEPAATEQKGEEAAGQHGKGKAGG